MPIHNVNSIQEMPTIAILLDRVPTEDEAKDDEVFVYTSETLIGGKPWQIVKRELHPDEKSALSVRLQNLTHFRGVDYEREPEQS